MAEKQQLPILSVLQVGHDDFERYLIKDQLSEMVWTGQRFNSDGAVLYAHHHQAATDIHTILKSNFEGVVPQRYVVPLYVEVFSPNVITLDQVAEYLSKASRLQINTPEHGNGPGDALVLPWIEWHRIDPIKEFPRD